MRRFRSCLLPLLFAVTFFLATLFHLFVLPELGIGAEQPLPSVLDDDSIPSSGLAVNASDLPSLTFSDLPPIQTSGEFISRPEWNEAVGYDLSRNWEVGQNIGQFLKLSDFQESLDFDSITLGDIAAKNLIAIDLDQTALSSFELLQWQSLSDIVKAVPKLSSFQVVDVPPVQALIDSIGISVGQLTIAQVLERYPQVGELLLGEINLNEFALTDIPNLVLARVADFSRWQNTLLSGVPGLSTLPFSSIPGLILSLFNLSKVDVAYGTAETDRTNTISGSYEEGFKVPCKEKCAYVEFAGASPLYNKSPIYGKQWISGKNQKVKGGNGILGKMCDGMEPTGRHTFGKAFKVVVWEIEESTGTVETALFFRISGGSFLGHSPYCVGPVAFITFHETDSFFLIGKLDEDDASTPSIPTEEIPTPSGTPPVLNEPEKAPSPQKPGCKGSFIHPAPGYPASGSGGRFGACRPLGSCRRRHAGIDVATPIRTPVIASDDGRVSFVGWMQGYGLAVDIQHCSYSTRYAHLDKALVQQGTKVTQGEAIAKSGNTGIGSGPHLHFEVRRGGAPLDPEIFIKF